MGSDLGSAVECIYITVYSPYKQLQVYFVLMFAGHRRRGSTQSRADMPSVVVVERVCLKFGAPA